MGYRLVTGPYQAARHGTSVFHDVEVVGAMDVAAGDRRQARRRNPAEDLVAVEEVVHCRAVARVSLVPQKREFFVLFSRAARNTSTSRGCS